MDGCPSHTHTDDDNDGRIDEDLANLQCCPVLSYEPTATAECGSMPAFSFDDPCNAIPPVLAGSGDMQEQVYYTDTRSGGTCQFQIERNFRVTSICGYGPSSLPSDCFVFQVPVCEGWLLNRHVVIPFPHVLLECL